MNVVKSTVEHYDLLIESDNDPVHDPSLLQEYMNRWDGDKFLSELKLNQTLSVLEIGVGTGRLALRVLKLGCKRFIGIDLSQKTIDRAKDNLRDYSNYTLIVGDYLDDCLDCKVDLIYSSLTFFHVKEKAAAIKKTNELLNPGGRFVVSIEKDTQEYFDYGDYKVKMYPDNRKHIIGLLESYEFTIENISEVDFAYIISAVKENDIS
ncbi:class I SAM-dependent methyltransferase [Lachnoclostridium phytofermentans]|uniref:Methyltransferase type 12 n=1 Tax=Lachnoclostridium phytofermentans (strain ATCC 700394 / DSM 18823 / ISDg) TaxID=357809 RepID=A9KLC9_LACP7|nr:class I SAM-dependent methyltransferase [Lachnoclostridium phytofermentans]ABX41258.1 Methyltransferase type 12 [Lachnoclostridium phytofermentans ISDg]